MNLLPPTSRNLRPHSIFQDSTNNKDSRAPHNHLQTSTCPTSSPSRGSCSCRLPNMQVSTLLRLLVRTIAKYDQLGLKADLKNLCLVCNETRDVATPLLYKNMVVSVDKLNSDFRQFIKTTKNHRGLPHVRTVRVVSKNSGDFVSSRRYKTLCQLISAIPRHVLTRFE